MIEFFVGAYVSAFVVEVFEVKASGGKWFAGLKAGFLRPFSFVQTVFGVLFKR